MCVGGLGWIYLAQYRDKLQGIVTVVMTLWVHGCSHDPSGSIVGKEFLDC
jgi:hypothetical protein